MEIKNLRDAWETFGVGNGVMSYEDLRRRVHEVLKLDTTVDGEINCIVLDNLEWLTTPTLTPPNRFSRRTSSAPSFSIAHSWGIWRLGLSTRRRTISSR
jgi:hypothetical protein